MLCSRPIVQECEKSRSYNLYFCPLLPVCKAYFSTEKHLITSPSLSTLAIFKPSNATKERHEPGLAHITQRCTLEPNALFKIWTKDVLQAVQILTLINCPFRFSSVNAFILLLESHYRYQNNSSSQEFRGIPSQLSREENIFLAGFQPSTLTKSAKTARQICSYWETEKESFSPEASGTT